MVKSLTNLLSRNATNFSGWKTNRKFVVIESDDWGSIRMPSAKAIENFLRQDIKVDVDAYCRVDSLASESDLEKLFEVLLGIKDSKGNNPIITANTVVANPDFEKIKNSDFKEYFYEPFTTTLKRYPEHENAFKIWEKGIGNKIFFPQYHGREHVNVACWLKLLRNNNPVIKYAFEQKCWGLPMSIIQESKINVQASYDMEDNSELKFQHESINTGLDLFEDIFGYKSKSFIANNFIWDSALELTLKDKGVEYIQGMKYQKLPLLDSKKRKLQKNVLGEKNKNGQTYLIRNCTFEPSQRNASFDSVNECLSEIANAFFWKKPAIITTHRLNFIGFIEEKNREVNLQSFKKLLQSIIKKWPDVEFVTSSELGQIINTNRSL